VAVFAWLSKSNDAAFIEGLERLSIQKSVRRSVPLLARESHLSNSSSSIRAGHRRVLSSRASFQLSRMWDPLESLSLARIGQGNKRGMLKVLAGAQKRRLFSLW
jgi:hypothetical protein